MPSDLVHYSFRMPPEMYKRLSLIPKGQRTRFLIDSLEAGLSYQDQSIARMQREISDAEKELETKKDLLAKKIRNISKKNKQEDILKERYTEFCGYLEKHDGDIYNTKRVNSKFGINLQGHKHFQKIEEQHREDKFTLEDFRELGDD